MATFKIDKAILCSALDLVFVSILPAGSPTFTGLYQAATGMYPYSPMNTTIFSNPNPPVSVFTPTSSFTLSIGGAVVDFGTAIVTFVASGFNPGYGELIANGTDPDMFGVFTDTSQLLFQGSITTSGGGGDMIISAMPTGLPSDDPEGFRLSSFVLDFSGVVV